MKTEKDSIEEEKVFIIQSYTKAELAQLYCPDLPPALALQKFYRWMQKCEALTLRLQQLGYNKYRHSFLKQEVRLIFEYLGEP